MTKERVKIIPAVYLVLIKNKKILLAQRQNTGFCDCCYSFPAGHLEEDETLLEAIIREAKEEINLELNQQDLTLAHTMHRKETNENRASFFFTAKKWKNTPKIMEPNKCNDLNWFDINTPPKNTIPYIKQAIQNILQNKNYSEYPQKKQVAKKNVQDQC